MQSYIHGFEEREKKRLEDQAQILSPTIYRGIDFNGCRNILEVGSGVGAQTLQLLERFPHLHVTCVECAETQIEKARENLRSPIAEGRVRLVLSRAEEMPFADETFDGAFVCWVLEHVPDTARVLGELCRVLKTDSVVHIREVFNKLWHTEPVRPELERYWDWFNERQQRLGGDPFVGAKLGCLLTDAGFTDIDLNTRGHLFDKRDISERNRFLAYWADLFVSAVSDEEGQKAKIRQEFAILSGDSQSSLFFGFIAARASKSL